MPGILPMKMIRVGTTTQSRIAQACDRCRSKKIRCDGVRPCCTQCSNVGFECKTSDKLSRRAFPRGYTESLEDRVRGLEAEVRELKQLLDEKDEKLDMLSRIHSFSPASRKASASLSPGTAAQVKAEVISTQEEILHVEIPAPVDQSTASTGNSTTSALIGAFEAKVQERGLTGPSIVAASILSPPASGNRSPTHADTTSVAPPRLLSDQYINVFFQEWQPMLPVLHRHTFLKLYEQFLLDSGPQPFSKNKQATAQLFLIFEIAAYSSSSKARPNTAAYELQWRKALSSASSAPSLVTLQCHVLAQLCYLLKADYAHLLRHRAYAVSMCHQLGMHQNHASQSLPPFESETRKKVFWCQYVLDKFASAVTGMPMLLRDSDITTEYPADVDDENLTPQGLSPALPGELTKISSALALFRMSRILAKTLEHLYPSRTTYQISITKLHSLSDELDQWHEELPEHLRLRFCNDKPATHLISDRSPLLSLGYFHTRSLIHRPLLCHGSGSAASAATIVLAAAAKHIVQIIDLLDERCMNYTFPINKQDLLLNASFSVLWQCIDLEEDSKLVRDNQKSLGLLLAKLSKENTSASVEFGRIASSFVQLSSPRASPPKHIDISSPAQKSLNNMPAPVHDKQQKSTRKQIQAIASRFSSFNNKSKVDEDPRRSSATQGGTSASMSPYHRANSTISLASTQSAPAMQVCTPSPKTTRPMGDSSSVVNLDYFPLGDPSQTMQTQNSSTTMLPPQRQSPLINNNTSWEQLVATLDNTMADGFSTIAPTALNKSISNPGTLDWSSELWPMQNFELSSPRANVPQSLLSFSEESMTSGDDFVFSTSSSHHGSMSTADGIDLNRDDGYKGIAMPVSSIEDDFDLHHEIAA